MERGELDVVYKSTGLHDVREPAEGIVEVL